MSNPIVPLTLEGASVLHQTFQVRWEEWRALDPSTRQSIVHEAVEWLEAREGAEGGEQSAAFAMLGHKGDLLLLHYRKDFVGLLEAQTQVSHLRLSEYMEQNSSYLSVVELGLYESTRKIYDELGERGLAEGTEAWDAAVAETLERQKKAMAGRLWPEIPESRYLCFYPMDRRRGEQKNWYRVGFAERQKMMHEHGLIGRKYGGVVKQVISGSIGLDDWEWAVDLFAASPLPFKQLIYEMRFDEVSADYALFGQFMIGLRVPSEGLAAFLRGEARAAVGETE
ncbi:MAG: heme-dependent peroxidase [Acidobacteria bacterium]|nr:heme-dependent peroxidase [Acidobacteriota bacterium]